MCSPTKKIKDQQVTHGSQKFSSNQRSIDIVILLESLNGPANLGAVFRNAEAFGVQHIWIHESNRMDLQSNRFKKTSRSTEHRVKYEYYSDFDRIINDFEGFKVAIEITEASRNIRCLPKQDLSKLLLVFGNEKHGISSEHLSVLDDCFHITMWGQNSSLNVSQTLGISLYEIRRTS